MTPEIVPAYGNLEHERPNRLEAMAFRAAVETIERNQVADEVISRQYFADPRWYPKEPHITQIRLDDARLRLGFASLALVRATGSSYEQSKEDYADMAQLILNRAISEFQGVRGKILNSGVFTRESARRTMYEDIINQTLYFLKVDERSPRWTLLAQLGLIRLETETQPWD